MKNNEQNTSFYLGTVLPVIDVSDWFMCIIYRTSTRDVHAKAFGHTAREAEANARLIAVALGRRLE